MLNVNLYFNSNMYCIPNYENMLIATIRFTMCISIEPKQVSLNILQHMIIATTKTPYLGGEQKTFNFNMHSNVCGNYVN